MESLSPSKKRTKLAFLPSKLELISLPSLSLLFLTAVNSFPFFKSADSTSYQIIIDLIRSRFKGALEYIDEQLGPTSLTIIIWLAIGLILYVSIRIAYASYLDYKSDIPTTRGMIVPKEYNQSKVAKNSIIRIITRFVATILLLVWVYLFFVEILPYASGTYLESITNLSPLNLAITVWSVVALSASIFLVSVLLRCVVLRSRFFS